MKINFKNPVMPVDPYSQLAFVEILNIILAARHIVDVNRLLINRNVNPQFGSLSGYFRWSFAGDCFTLWQRMDYNSMLCFNPATTVPQQPKVVSWATQSSELGNSAR